MTPGDVAQAVPLTQDPAFKAAMVAFVVALTTLAGYIGGWFMRQSKAKREEDEAAPGLPPSARRELETMKGEVKALAEGLDALNEKADDLAGGIERASERIQDIDDKVNDAAQEVARLTEAMDWVKDSLRAIKDKLGV